MHGLRIVLLATALSASPALAQRVNTYTGINVETVARAPDMSIRGEIGQIDDSIRDGRRSGQLTRSEASRLRREGRQIEVLEDRFGSDGLSSDEQAEIDNRTAVLNDQVIAARTAGAGRN